MDAARSAAGRAGVTPHKLLMAGGFAVGKTTMVAAISEVRPLLTEEKLTTASVGHDDLQGVPGKTTTTVALDYGRITFANELVLYLFAVPGQERSWFMWPELPYCAPVPVLPAVLRACRRRSWPPGSPPGRVRGRRRPRRSSAARRACSSLTAARARAPRPPRPPSASRPARASGRTPAARPSWRSPSPGPFARPARLTRSSG